MANSLVLNSTRKSSESPLPLDDDLIREWLARFATNCGQPPSDARMLLWIDELQDIEPERLAHTFRAVMRSHTFNSIPQIGEIRAQIDEANAAGLQLEAESAWETYLGHVKRFFHPDIGWNRRAPCLSAIIEHCARVAGGPHWVECCPESELQWVRKRFIDAYKLVQETGQVEHLLSDGEGKNILRSLNTTLSPAPSQMLAAAPDSLGGPGPLAPDDPLRAEFDAVFQRLKVSRPAPPPLTPEQWERSAKAQKARLHAYLAEHPEIAGAAQAVCK